MRPRCPPCARPSSNAPLFKGHFEQASRVDRPTHSSCCVLKSLPAIQGQRCRRSPAAAPTRTSTSCCWIWAAARRNAAVQLEDNRKYCEERLQTIDSDLEREPERIRRTFALQASRVELAGAIYLWPQGVVPQEVR